MIGWCFTANVNLAIAELGYFDYGGNGLSESHRVGIWDEGGALLASADVLPGSPLDGSFRYVPIPSVSLVAGQTYVIGGFQSNQSNPISLDGARLGSVSILPEISFVESRVSFVPSFSQPQGGSVNVVSGAAFSGGSTPVIGPNFKYSLNATAIPEPGTSLFAVALAAVGALQRRRARNS
jgi:uncharacterized protein (TIGR03382 family)